MPGEGSVVEVVRKSLKQSDLPFRDFVELALYHPLYGYYCRDGSPIGPKGDFVTAPALSPVFAFTLGKLIDEFMSRAGDGVSQVVDIGCGDGALIRELAKNSSATAYLGVDRSHSRPRVSNDNPFSEAAFKTLKYAPVFPEAFGSLADTRAFCETFFSYYNHEHRHSGIGLHTPASVHHGTAIEIRAQRQQTLNTAHAEHPHRFGNRRPQAPRLPTAAWINQPSPEALIQTA